MSESTMYNAARDLRVQQPQTAGRRLRLMTRGYTAWCLVPAVLGLGVLYFRLLSIHALDCVDSTADCWWRVPLAVSVLYSPRLALCLS